MLYEGFGTTVSLEDLLAVPPLVKNCTGGRLALEDAQESPSLQAHCLNSPPQDVLPFAAQLVANEPTVQLVWLTVTDSANLPWNPALRVWPASRGCSMIVTNFCAARLLPTLPTLLHLLHQYMLLRASLGPVRKPNSCLGLQYDNSCCLQMHVPARRERLPVPGGNMRPPWPSMI